MRSICDICKKEFDNEKSLICHRALHFRKGGPLTEKDRKNKSIDQDLLNDDFKCETCGKKFKSLNALNGHKAYCGGKLKTCPICNREISELRFNSHYKSCKNKEDKFNNLIVNKQYVVCEICGKKAFHLKKHIKTNHNITVKEYKKMYPNCRIVADDIEEKARESYNDKYGIPSRGAAFPNDPINKCEKIIDDMTPKNVIYTNSKYYICYKNDDGKRIVRNPDFIVVEEQFADSIIEELNNNNKLSEESKKHIKKVIEHFGDYWHGEYKTGKTNEEHEKDVVNDYKNMGKKCLVIWEHELKDNIDIIKQKIEEYMKI